MCKIWKNLDKCQPLPSLPDKYNKDKGFKRNIMLTDILKLVDNKENIYKFRSQVVNFTSNTIAIIVEKKNDIMLQRICQ